MSDQPEVVGQIILLHPDQIDASGRLLPLDQKWVAELAVLMKVDGQLTPVEVCRLPGRADYKLVTGAHRHGAAAANGSLLRAEVITNDAIQRRLREASENVNRRNLKPIDRAKAIAELVEVQKAAAGISAGEDGRRASAKARWQKTVKNEADDASAVLALAYGWADEVAERARLGRRTIYNDLELLRGIPSTIAEALRRADHPAFHNASQLKALAGLEPDEQQQVLGLLIHANAKIAGAPFDKVTDAVAALRGKEPPRPDAKRLNAFTGAFARMAAAEKKGALAELSRVLPAGFRIVEGKEVAASPPSNAAQLRAALDVTFGIIARLATGEEVVDDDELEAARRLAQAALFESHGVKMGEGA